ncbi:MAG: M56 family metallopeptidase [Planctomycetota bacterium]
MSQVLQSDWMARLSWVLLHSLWQFALVAAVVFCVSRVLFSTSSRAQYWSTCLGLLLLAACPIATWHVISDQTSSRTVSFAQVQASAEPKAIVATDASTIRSIAESPAAIISVRTAPGNPPFRATQNNVWNVRWLALAWMIGAALFSARPMIGFWGQHRLKRGAIGEASPELRRRLAQVATEIRVRRKVSIFLTEQRLGPMVIGGLRPIILVPAALVTNLSTREIETLLAHELAHIRRHDCIANALQVMIETVFFYHPAVWWLSREMRITREYCCDEMAARDATSRLALGRALLAIENDRSQPRTLALAAVDGDLLRRVRRLSAKQEPPTPSLIARVLVGFTGLLSLVALASALDAQEAPHSEPPSAPTAEATLRDQSATESEPRNRERDVDPSGDTEMESTDIDVGETEQPNDDTAKTVHWDLDLEQCIAIALQNAQVERPLVVPLGEPSSGSSADARRKAGVAIALDDEDQSIDEFETRVRDRLYRVELAYWDLVAAFHSAEATRFGLQQARVLSELARRNSRIGTGTRQEVAAAEAMHRELRSRYRNLLNDSPLQGKILSVLYQREQALRQLLGIAAADGRLIRPTQTPQEKPSAVDWGQALADANRVVLKRHRQRLDDLNRELTKAKDNIAAELEINAHSLESLSFNSPKLLYEYNSLGVRRALSQLRRIQLERARAKAAIREQENMLAGVLSQAMAKTASLEQLSQTEALRVQASAEEYDLRHSEYESGRTPVTVVLQSLERFVEAKQRHHQTLCEHMKSLSNVLMIRGASRWQELVED